MRKQFEKEEKRAGVPASTAANSLNMGSATKLRKPTPRTTSCDAVSLKTTSMPAALAPPYFVRAEGSQPATQRSDAPVSSRSARPSARDAPPLGSSRMVSARELTNRSSYTQRSARQPTGRPADTGRSDDILETVRSDWDTARVEKKLAKLMDEKRSIMARIQEVDDALELEETKKRTSGFGRRGAASKYPAGSSFR
jgi:hypothetical protein